MKLLLANNAIDLNFKDNDSGTPLSWAVIKGQKEMVQILLENNFDFDAKNGCGSTALQLASFRYHRDVEQLLIETGASQPDDFYGLHALFSENHS